MSEIRDAPRRGQFEMIGLVFIVLIIIVGVFLYVVLGSKNTNGTARSILHEEAMRSYLLTLAQTDVTECDANVYAVAKACEQREAIGPCNNACAALQDALDKIVDNTLKMQGLKYNLTLEDTKVMVATTSCHQKTSMTYAAPELPIPVDGGVKRMTLALCK